jgi:hypothetical protein
MRLIPIPSELPSRRRALRAGILALLGAAALLAGAAPSGQEPQTARQPAQQQSPAPQNLDAASTVRQHQLTDDSARLLTLAISLKAEVDKTNKDTLSLSVIRKAGAIEKLAHDVKDKMKLPAGGS